MEPGDLLSDRYRVGELLGRGGMADVHRGEDLRLERPVALKVLRPELGRDPDVRRRFEAEARWAASLSHPNIVGVYDVGEDSGRAYLVMELLPGRTLADRIRSGPLTQPEALRIIAEVLSALATAHAAGVLHRDIKPANILLAADGTAKVTDFGIAKALDPERGGSSETTASLVVGTPSYLAPERMQGEPASVASDLWSVGVVLYEALAGVAPFTGDTAMAIALAAERSQMVPLREHNPDVSPAVASVVEGALRPRPADRYPSAAAMLDALSAAPMATAVMAVPPADATVAMRRTQAVTAAAPPAPPPAPPPRRGVTGRQAAVLAVVLLLLAGLIAAVILASSQNSPPRSTTTTSSPTSTTVASSTTSSTAPATTTTTAPPSTTTTLGTTTTSSLAPTTTAPTTSVSVSAP